MARRGSRTALISACAVGNGSTTPFNAPSIPVLFRLGLIAFNIDRGQEATKFYRIKLTDTGLIILKLTKDRTE